jgi:predicted enzyme related to lactoylglutathione lyase
MAQPVVHFEIVGRDPAGLRNYYGNLFGWEFDTSNPVVEEVSEPDDYGFVDAAGDGIPGGVGGGPGYAPQTVFYVLVPNVEEALRSAERLGGTRRMGPSRRPDGGLVVGHFTDPEGNLMGLAGPA